MRRVCVSSTSITLIRMAICPPFGMASREFTDKFSKICSNMLTSTAVMAGWLLKLI